jgi:hypothetical protein
MRNPIHDTGRRVRRSDSADRDKFRESESETDWKPVAGGGLILTELGLGRNTLYKNTQNFFNI